MKLPIFQIDTFSDKVFEGTQLVVPLSGLKNDVLLKLLKGTVFAKRGKTLGGSHRHRNGFMYHATLATAHCIL